MTDLLVKEAELQQLQGMINELPTKFGVPLLNFFNGVANLRAQEAKNAQEAENPSPKKESTPGLTENPDPLSSPN